MDGLKAFAGALAAVAFLTVTLVAADEGYGDGAGIVVGKKVTSKDVGLPRYPGSSEIVDDAGGASSLRFGAWLGESGFKIAVLKLSSNDAPEKVEAYYRKALGKYGTVVRCPGASPEGAGELDCAADSPGPGEIVLKAGTKSRQHVVGIEPAAGGGTAIHLVSISTSGG